MFNENDRAASRLAFDALKREVLARTDLADLVVSCGVELKRKGKEMLGICPFHNEKTGSFTVTPETQLYHCFGCKKSGDAIQFMIDHQRLDFHEAVYELAEKAGIRVDDPRRPTDDTKEIRSLCSAAADYYHRELLKHADVLAYLTKRGLTRETIEKYRIGFAPESGNALRNVVKAADSAWLASGVFKAKEGGRPYAAMRSRVVFPITDSRARVIALGGRAWLADQQPKYLNTGETPIYTKGNALFGLPQARPSSLICLVEGYFDAIGMTQAGFPSISSCGTAVTEGQLREALRAAETLVIGLDPDFAGRTATLKAVMTAIPLMRGNKRLRVAAWPGGRDVDETLLLAGGRDQIELALGASVAATDFLFAEILPSGSSASLEERASAVEKLDTLLAAMGASALKDQLDAKRRELRGQRPETRRAPVAAPSSPTRTSGQLLVAGLLANAEARGAFWLDSMRLPESIRLLVDHLAGKPGPAAVLISDAPEGLAAILRDLSSAVPGDIEIERVETAYWRAVLDHLGGQAALGQGSEVWGMISEAQARIDELSEEH